MQPPTEASIPVPETSTRPRQRGDEDALYRRHHRDLVRAVARVINAPHELIEDACQNAWTILLRRQPDRVSIFAWLRVVAVHEAYRLCRAQQRYTHLEELDHSEGWEALIADGGDIDDAVEARRALRLLAELPERQREDLSLLVAGFSYREIAEMTGGRTFTNVNKHLTRAHSALHQLAEEAGERPALWSNARRGAPMVRGSCRRCGLRPRRVRRGMLEPLCEECYREAMDKVARELAEEAAAAGRERFRKMKLVPTERHAERAPERVAPVARADARPLGVQADARLTDRGRQTRLRCISEELLGEARRLYGLGLSMRAVAETVLDRTSYANAHSAAVALRFQFKRRGWPLRNHAKARTAQDSDDTARAA